jgi:hypothetical protein
MLSAGLLGVLPCAAMADSAAHPASTVLCQSLHQAVQPALTGLMKNDNLLERANRALIANESDRVTLRSLTESIAVNLNAVTQLLGQKFPQNDDPATVASEELMKSRLQAVASHQVNALNVIEGYIQAQDLAQANGESYFSPDRNAPGDFRDKNDPAKATIETPVGSPATLLQIARTQIGALEDSAGIAIMAVVKVCNSPHP